MRRFLGLFLVMLGCCLLFAALSGRAAGNDQRIAMFRALTSEQSTGRATPAVAETEQVPVTAAPIDQENQPANANNAVEVTPQAGGTLTSAPSPHVPVASRASLPPVRFYGGSSALATLSQLPRRAPVEPAPQRATRLAAKPFQYMSPEPTLSPYLNLDRGEEDSETVPNYFTFVRPQVEQQSANRMQQRELQQLRGQVQSMAAIGAAPQYQASQSAGMGAPARYMNTGQFYNGAR